MFFSHAEIVLFSEFGQLIRQRAVWKDSVLTLVAINYHFSSAFTNDRKTLGPGFHSQDNKECRSHPVCSFHHTPMPRAWNAMKSEVGSACSINQKGLKKSSLQSNLHIRFAPSGLWGMSDPFHTNGAWLSQLTFTDNQMTNSYNYCTENRHQTKDNIPPAKLVMVMHLNNGWEKFWQH